MKTCLFFYYEGIKRMTAKEFFGAEGPLYRFGGVLFDIFYVNILWMIFGGALAVLILNMLPLPDTAFVNVLKFILDYVFLLHLGPASTASLAALGKRARKEESYTFRDFWKSYKQNYKQALGVTALLSVFVVMLGYSVWVEFHNKALFGKMLYVTVPVQAFVSLELVIVLLYLYALLARFEMTNRDLLKYAFLMGNKHIPTTLLCLGIFLGVTAATFLWNLGFGLIGYGVYFYLSAMLMERVFRNYMPDEETERTEEKQEQEEAETLSSNHSRMTEAERQAIIDRYSGRKSSMDEDDKNRGRKES